MTPPELRLPEGAFARSARRGKQLNSLIHKWRDPNTGAGRDALFMSREGGRVRVKSDNGAEMQCGVHIAAIKPRNVQAFWPERNVLLRRRVCDVAAGIPDYNAVARITPIRVGEQTAVGVSIAAH